MVLFPGLAFSQKKADRILAVNLKQHDLGLGGDSGTMRPGAHDALRQRTYIAKQFESMGLRPSGENGSFFQYILSEGKKQYEPGTTLSINNEALDPGTAFVPLSFSGRGAVKGQPLIAVQERKQPWIMDLNNYLGASVSDPSALNDTLYQLTRQAVQNGATAVIFFNSTANTPDLQFSPEGSHQPLPIPALYVHHEAAGIYFKDPTSSVDIVLNVTFSEKKDTTFNIIGFLDNHAPYTVILTAESISDKSVLLELARLFRGDRAFSRENYLFVALTGAAPGKEGARYFIQHPGIGMGQVNCVLFLDHASDPAGANAPVEVRGIASARQWQHLLDRIKNKAFELKTSPAPDSILTNLRIPSLSFSAAGGTTSGSQREVPMVHYLYTLVAALNKTGKLTYTASVTRP